MFVCVQNLAVHEENKAKLVKTPWLVDTLINLIKLDIINGANPKQCTHTHTHTHTHTCTHTHLHRQHQNNSIRLCGAAPAVQSHHGG